MTNNKQQTAVEWLFDRIKIKADSISCNTQNNRMVKGAYVDCLMLIMEAKKMELEQIKHAHERGQSDEKDYWNIGDKVGVRFMVKSEEYYNETYGGGEQ